ncbi:hypothetical protein A1O1_09134 [Capronia coronata CBS 617.96]|uniref:N-acetyltransferase domain-containing protein n=1 Tax=Capronia coronata CBS 617.96 TaxID=1182541 RepID=W9XE37_9EURO|nr:uncharacterized protein A1O1_09134 [Capronia coronata CBS 617.96]EXJ78732.1 hypothetical protein A1O1_09134 [Capronia coronata CBS 617.96]
MPQETLLSYFSKPITSVSNVPDSNTGRSNKARGHSEDGTVLLEDSLTKEGGLGVMGQLHQQSWKEVSKPMQGEAKTPNPEACDTDRKVSKESSLWSSLGQQGEYPKIIQIRQLPGTVITAIQKAHIPSIQRLTATTLPVRYGDAFFSSTLSEPTSFQLSRVVLYSSEPVGWIRCRLEPCSPNNNASLSKPALAQIYIQALALLSPYRGLGIATMLLNAVLESSIAKEDGTVCIYAHVWEKNQDALEWYGKRGFKRVVLMERYYKRLRPGGAWIVRKELDTG